MRTHKKRPGAGFRQRVYLWVLALFLVFFNATVLGVAWHSNNRAFTSQRDKLLTEQQYIVQSLAEDIRLIATSRPLGLPLLYRHRIDELAKDSVLLCVEQAEEVYSSFPAELLLENRPAAGQRVWYVTDLAGHGRMLVASTALNGEQAGITITAAFPMQEFFDNWRELLRTVILLSLGCSVLLAASLSLLLRVLTAPLANLETATRSLSGGEYTARVPVRGRDELARLAQSFNDMAGQLEENIRTLRDAAEEKQRLLDALSHELRTPLAGISASVQYMQMARLDEADYYGTLDGMAFEAHRMQNLTDSMLSLSALQHGGTLPQEECLLDEIARRAIDVLRPRAKQAGVALHLAQEESLSVTGDPVLLESLLTNLLDNACKACAQRAEDTPQQNYLPLVQLCLCRRDGIPVVQVRDNGAGMSAETLRRVGEPFYREDKARSRRWGGAGLGVSICRAIADAHGATLEYESQKGEGTTATLRFL